MADPMFNRSAGPESPAWNAAAVTVAPGDLPLIPTRALYVGGAGNVTVTMAGGASVEFVGVPAGSILPIRVDRVTAATATGIVALY